MKCQNCGEQNPKTCKICRRCRLKIIPRKTPSHHRRKVKILIDDPSGRFKNGDEGVLIENNFDKYDYHVELADSRTYYFYKNEIEIR